MGYTNGCEPLRVWNRLEPRARRTDFTQTLRAEIHDPLWLLARQWQFGEFKGEDAGSPIFAKVAVRTAEITELSNRGGVEPYGGTIPMEARVERGTVPVDPARRAQIGRQWLAILDRHGRRYAGAPAYDAASYRARFVAAFPCGTSPPDDTGPAAVIARARAASNPRLAQYERAIAGRGVDGLAVAAAIPPGPVTWIALPDRLTAGIPDEHRAWVIAALEDLRAWRDSVWTEPQGPTDTAWNESQLEHRFDCRVPRPDGTRLALRADEYAGERLDWHSFELGAEALPGDGSRPSVETFTAIPSLAEYPGQPSPRFWQFEDGAVDLGNIRADTTDLARLVVAEFALVYGNNWFVIPCAQRVGTLAEIEGLVVTDVFGQRTLVQSATRGAPESWARWDLFSLDGRGGGLGEHLFLPPVVSAVFESEPVESVRFTRDEMANTVWAIETRVHDGLGGGRDRAEAARRFAEAIERAEPPPSDQAPTANSATLRYVLGTTVPENWIPFLPVHRPSDDRAVRLQRASMPRFFQNTVRPVRPWAGVLRAGLTDDDRQVAPYFVHEEEVPRAGVQIDATFQRARWLHGGTAVWYGLRKRTGRGVGSSGLRFDLVEDT